eukprot:9474351-Pyramimonas_sp.AAC.1
MAMMFGPPCVQIHLGPRDLFSIPQVIFDSSCNSGVLTFFDSQRPRHQFPSDFGGCARPACGSEK